MRTLLKVFVALALVLPLGAFVAGSLVASSADAPAPQHTIVIEKSGSETGAPGAVTASPTPEPGDDDADDLVDLATPEPGDVDDPGDDEADDHGHDVGDDHGDDSSGHGGGGGDDDHRSGSGHDDHSGSDD